MRRLIFRMILVAIPLAATPASAQPKPAPKAPAAKPVVDTKPAIEKLKSGDEAKIKEALDDLRIAGPGGASAAPAVSEALGKGLSLVLTESAIETLGDLEAESGSAVLAQYATHRNLKVRRAAVKALTRTKGAAAASAFKKALSDKDPMVRGVAASGLGAIKAKDAVPDLFVALDHRVNEAAAAIGILCAGQQCEDLSSRLGKHPFDVVTSGLDQVIFRPAAEVPDDLKIKVIGHIRELGTMQANTFLKDVQKRWPANGSARVKQSIDQAVSATAGGSQ